MQQQLINNYLLKQDLVYLLLNTDEKQIKAQHKCKFYTVCNGASVHHSSHVFFSQLNHVLSYLSIILLCAGIGAVRPENARTNRNLTLIFPLI